MMSKVDWSKAPEGAEFYACGNFHLVNGEQDVYSWSPQNNSWDGSSFWLFHLKNCDSYEERSKEEKPSGVMIGNEFGSALVKSLGLDPSKVSSDIKLNMGSDEMFSVELRVNLTVDEVRKACDICDEVKV